MRYGAIKMAAIIVIVKAHCCALLILELNSNSYEPKTDQTVIFCGPAELIMNVKHAIIPA